MVNNSKNHSQVHCSKKRIRTGMAFLMVLFLLIGCNSKIQENQNPVAQESRNIVIQESQNSVSVSGIGRVLAQPDMILINISFSHTAPTTKEAKKVLEQKMQRILKILQEENVEDKFMKTTSLNYGVQYDYRNGQMIRIGQRAQQTIVVTINDIVNTPERFSSILDKITTIDRVEIQNINFDIEDKSELFKQSRELAYQKAFDKAAQYAELSGRKLGKVLTISEGISQDVAQTHNIKQQVLSITADSSIPLPTGEEGITTEINVSFSLE